jgi:hypothetical protein
MQGVVEVGLSLQGVFLEVGGDCQYKELLRWDCPCQESFLRSKGLSLQGVVLEVKGTVPVGSSS